MLTDAPAIAGLAPQAIRRPPSLSGEKAHEWESLKQAGLQQALFLLSG